MKIIIKRVSDSWKEIFGSSHHSVFTWKNRPADRALSSRVRAIAVRAWGVF